MKNLFARLTAAGLILGAPHGFAGAKNDSGQCLRFLGRLTIENPDDVRRKLLEPIDEAKRLTVSQALPRLEKLSVELNALTTLRGSQSIEGWAIYNREYSFFAQLNPLARRRRREGKQLARRDAELRDIYKIVYYVQTLIIYLRNQAEDAYVDFGPMDDLFNYPALKPKTLEDGLFAFLDKDSEKTARDAYLFGYPEFGRPLSTGMYYWD